MLVSLAFVACFGLALTAMAGPSPKKTAPAPTTPPRSWRAAVDVRLPVAVVKIADEIQASSTPHGESVARFMDGHWWLWRVETHGPSASNPENHRGVSVYRPTREGETATLTFDPPK